MKKTLHFAVIAVFAAFIFPLVTHAAWWNPSDWFKAHPEVPPETIVDLPIVQEESGPDSQPDSQPATSTPQKIVTKYVADPDMALQITALTQENKGQGELIVLLQNQIASLQAKLSDLSAKASKPEEAYANDLVKAPISKFCSDLLNEADSYKEQADAKDASWRGRYDLMSSNPEISNKESKLEDLRKVGTAEVTRLLALSKEDGLKFDTLCR